MAIYTRCVTSYWQDKKTGQVIRCDQPTEYKPSPEWYHYFRKVRLLHNPVDEKVEIEDAGSCLSYMDDPNWLEVDLETFRCWDMIYRNPDI